MMPQNHNHAYESRPTALTITSNYQESAMGSSPYPAIITAYEILLEASGLEKPDSEQPNLEKYFTYNLKNISTGDYTPEFRYSSYLIVFSVGDAIKAFKPLAYAAINPGEIAKNPGLFAEAHEAAENVLHATHTLYTFRETVKRLCGSAEVYGEILMACVDAYCGFWVEDLRDIERGRKELVEALP